MSHPPVFLSLSFARFFDEPFFRALLSQLLGKALGSPQRVRLVQLFISLLILVRLPCHFNLLNWTHDGKVACDECCVGNGETERQLIIAV
jgi:hypothetical protein